MPKGEALVTNTPNFLGALFNTDPRRSQFLTLAGGLDGSNSEIATAVEFPITVDYEIGKGAQPKISEKAAMGEGNPEYVGKLQTTNVIQIHQADVAISNLRQRATGSLSGLAISGQTPEAANEEAFQIQAALNKMKRDMNYSAVNGKYSNAGMKDSNAANGTRGILEAITKNVVEGELNAENIGELVRLVFDNGALSKPVLFANSKNRQLISKAYHTESLTEVDRDRLSGGVAVSRVITEFGDVYLATDNDFPADVVALVDMDFVKPVFTRDDRTGEIIKVEQKDQRGGRLWELYAEFGLNHGADQLHAKLNIKEAEVGE